MDLIDFVYYYYVTITQVTQATDAVIHCSPHILGQNNDSIGSSNNQVRLLYMYM